MVHFQGSYSTGELLVSETLGPSAWWRWRLRVYPAGEQHYFEYLGCKVGTDPKLLKRWIVVLVLAESWKLACWLGFVTLSFSTCLKILRQTNTKGLAAFVELVPPLREIQDNWVTWFESLMTFWDKGRKWIVLCMRRFALSGGLTPATRNVKLASPSLWSTGKRRVCETAGWNSFWWLFHAELVTLMSVSCRSSWSGGCYIHMNNAESRRLVDVDPDRALCSGSSEVIELNIQNIYYVPNCDRPTRTEEEHWKIAAQYLHAPKPNLRIPLSHKYLLLHFSSGRICGLAQRSVLVWRMHIYISKRQARTISDRYDNGCSQWLTQMWTKERWIWFMIYCTVNYCNNQQLIRTSCSSAVPTCVSLPGSARAG